MFKKKCFFKYDYFVFHMVWLYDKLCNEKLHTCILKERERERERERKRERETKEVTWIVYWLERIGGEVRTLQSPTAERFRISHPPTCTKDRFKKLLFSRKQIKYLIKVPWTHRTSSAKSTANICARFFWVLLQPKIVFFIQRTRKVSFDINSYPERHCSPNC